MRASWIVATCSLALACGPPRTGPDRKAPPPPPPEAPPPASEAIVSEEFDVALAIPTGKGTSVERGAGYFAVEWIDITHTDGRLVNFIANAMRGGSALALAREMRDQQATQNPCTLPEPAEFLGRDGARFTCELGDGKGAYLISTTERCFWSVMITKRGAPEEFEPHVAATLARITVPSGAEAPNVERCY